MILEIVVLLNTFVKTDICFKIFGKQSSKEQHLFKINFLVVLLMYSFPLDLVNFMWSF